MLHTYRSQITVGPDDVIEPEIKSVIVSPDYIGLGTIGLGAIAPEGHMIGRKGGPPGPAMAIEMDTGMGCLDIVIDSANRCIKAPCLSVCLGRGASHRSWRSARKRSGN